jgi:RNA polymerase sigma-70 factor (ECF subfamily)
MGTSSDPNTSNFGKANVDPDDHRLIADCLEGRTAAYGELVRRYQDRLYNTIYRLLDNAEDAQDVLQEAFWNAYIALDKFKGDAQFFTWLYRIAFNAAISLRRKQRSSLSVRSGQWLKGESEPLDTSDSSRPQHEMERAEEERRIQQALNRLSPDHRIVLILKDIEGQKYSQMAEILGVPVGTIRSRLHRARMEMRDILARGEEQTRG